jgi:hypothetical protein
VSSPGFTSQIAFIFSRRTVEFGKSDVGANIVYFALLWAATNPRNTVLASPRNSQFLKFNVARNGSRNLVGSMALPVVSGPTQ